MEIITNLVGWWEQSMVKQMNYPTKNTWSIWWISTIYGSMLGAGLLSVLYHIELFITSISYLLAGIGIAGFIIFCSIYLFYDQVVKPMKAYEQQHGSCGLGDQWMQQRHEKKNKTKPTKTIPVKTAS